MTYRVLACIGALAALLSAPVSAQAPKPAAKAKSGKIPRTADGHPDFQGVWTNATITPLERPSRLKDKPTLSDAEAAAFEKSDAEELQKQDGQSDGPLIAAAGSSGTGGYNVLFVDRGTELARVDGVKRTSLVVDPPDGRVPPLTDEAKKRIAGMMRSFNRYDSIKERPLSERCIIGFGSTSGPPMMPVLYNNNYQIVQTPDTIMILIEMVHDIRIIRMNGTHPPADVRELLGDSVGHWEGDTLVVETVNFEPRMAIQGNAVSDAAKVTERFTRIDADTVTYQFTVDDPKTWVKPFSGEYNMVHIDGNVYEYACHEGNYGMANNLSGARATEKK
jgi:hypothetical protein